MVYDELIEKALVDFNIVSQFENEKFIYVFYSDKDFSSVNKKYKEELLSGLGPLIIDKITGEYKFLQISEFLTDEYFDSNIFPESKKLNQEEIFNRIKKKEYINPDDLFDLARNRGFIDFIIEICDSNFDEVKIISDTEFINTFFIDILNKLKANYSIDDSLSILLRLDLKRV